MLPEFPPEIRNGCPKSPGRGDCFSSGTGWPEGKGYAEGGGKEDQQALQLAVCSAFPAASPLWAAQTFILPAVGSLSWALWPVTKEGPPHQLPSSGSSLLRAGTVL